MQQAPKPIVPEDNISLRLTNYNDIFSSFDPRPYSERSLSVDFLAEAKRASVDKPSGRIELRIMVPQSARKPEDEKVIARRLRAHFERHRKIIAERHRKTVNMGIKFTLSGVAMMFLAAFLLFEFMESSLLLNFLVILFEPAGWFLFWEGLDQVVFESKKIGPELNFYSRMAKSSINFMSC